jgi:RNA polymerase sigma-70 factor (ECF subfamily)
MTEAESAEFVDSLYESWYPAAVRYALHLTSHFDVAEDTVQDAFLCLYRDLRSGRAIQNPKAWILKVIRVKVRVRMGNMRHEAARTDTDVVLDNLPAAVRLLEEETEVGALCSTLSEREREVLFLRLSEMKYREIAQELGISSSSVNTLLARALRKLQQAAGRPFPEGLSMEKAEGDVRQTLQ